MRAPNVVIATGGFEWDDQLKRSFLRGPLTHPVSVPTNTGDGLRMAMRVGAMLGNMREAWWMPVIEVPEDVVPNGRQLLTAERTFPGSIMVNRPGRRFTNEAANYNAFGAAFHEQDTTLGVYKNLPCWMVFNQDSSTATACGDITGGAGVEREASAPDWLISSGTLAGLAGELGVPADGLEETVRRFNEHARAGHDPDFHRGDGIFDRWYGDPSRRDGTRGADAGAARGRAVLRGRGQERRARHQGRPADRRDRRRARRRRHRIEGLYAAGNAMASPMGMTYGGAGGTLGPAMIFGYLAGRDIARTVQGANTSIKAGATSR